MNSNFDPLKGVKSKVKKYVIIGALGFIGIFGLLFIIAISMTSVYLFASEAIEQVENFFNRLGNFLTFHGWCTDSECTSVAMKEYYEELDNTYKDYESRGIEIDTDLITGTIFYDKYDYSVEPPNLSDDEEGMTDEEKEFIAFYRKAKGNVDKLASKMVSGTYLNFTIYKQYLINTYIPDNYSDLLSGLSGESRDNMIENIADQMMLSASKKDQSYLANGTCSSNLSNIKVKLYSCGYGHTGKEEYYVETVDFDEYVKGVVLAEEGGVVTNTSNEEFVKAFILAAKSYTLGRGVRYMTPSYFDLDSPVLEIELQNCSNDQNYKDYSKATSTQKAIIDRLYDETIDQILVTKDGSTRVKQAGYMNNDSNACGSNDCTEGNGSLINVTEAAKLSQRGYTYDQILTYYYGSNYAIKNIDTECTNTGNVTGDFTEWKQYGSNGWSQIQIGCGSVAKCGCLATSVAIQIANAAANGGLKLKVQDFDPGVFITTLKNNGGFSGGGSFQWSGWNSITDDWYCDDGNALNGTVAQKAATLKKKLDEGWYPIVNVKYGGCGQHWVAILAVNGNTIIMADPASLQTELNKSSYSCFVNGNQSRVRYCKVK